MEVFFTNSTQRAFWAAGQKQKRERNSPPRWGRHACPVIACQMSRIFYTRRPTSAMPQGSNNRVWQVHHTLHYISSGLVRTCRMCSDISSKNVTLQRPLFDYCSNVIWSGVSFLCSILLLRFFSLSIFKTLYVYVLRDYLLPSRVYLTSCHAHGIRHLTTSMHTLNDSYPMYACTYVCTIGQYRVGRRPVALFDNDVKRK